MIIYIGLFVMLLIAYRYIKYGKFEIRDFIILATMIGIAGVREGIGTDYGMYKSFYFYPKQQATEKVEWGYMKLMEFVKLIFQSNYVGFFIVCSCITLVLVYLWLKRNAKNTGLALLMFVSLGFYTLSFNLVRQSIAIAIVLYATKFIEEKKIIKYCIAIMLASTFHTTALIMLPVYFIGKIKLNKVLLRKLFLVSLFAGILFDPIFNFVVSNITQYKMYKSYSANPGIGTYFIGGIYLVIIAFIILKREIMVKNEYERICLNIAVCAVPFIVLSTRNILFARLIYYLFLPVIIPLSNITEFFKDKRTQGVFNIILIIILFIIYTLNIIFLNGVYPYKCVFLQSKLIIG